MIVASRGRNPSNSSDRTTGSPTEQRLEPNYEGISNNLTSVQKDNMVFDGRIRRLTPTECERLQGFPDGWTEGFSDTQRYKMLGNAVTVNVIRTIMERRGGE
jgi:site-specific DNA-cytosine methylase